jgi:regulator of cell morphogenesis and NO signaling
MNITQKSIIGELVAENYRAAEVFAKYNIDFCCKGNQAIADVCEKKNIVTSELIADLVEATKNTEKAALDYQSWPLDLLADYIEKKHHRYVTEKTPVIQKYLAKVSLVHGKAHPELVIIAEEFNSCAIALAAHMKKEELILFPFIRKMALSENTIFEPPRGMKVEAPINMMKHEHEIEGERFHQIAKLSNNYTPPPEACNTYRVTYSLLKEFEQDLHLHIHLENNILFPRALAMEASLSQTSCSI